MRKDLETLRKYGILERRMYRWGYYLGTGAMSSQEFKVALNALFTQAKFQGDPQVRRICDQLSRRLRGLNIESKGELFYPVRQYLNRVIVYTDPEEMASLGKNRNNLFHQLSVVEKAISQGQLIEILRSSDPYKNNRIGTIQVYPSQLIYHDIAWYLLYELELIPVKVRFYPPVTTFILEGERRHPKQKIIKGAKDKATGEILYVDYIVLLPPRSFDEFLLWVNKYMASAQVLYPQDLVQKL